MSTIYFYLRDDTNEYVGTGESTFDIEGNEVIPPEATIIAPPAYTPGVNIPVFDYNTDTWGLVDDFRGTGYLSLDDYSIGMITEIDTPLPPNTTTSFNNEDFNIIGGEAKPNLLLDSDFKFWTEGLTVAPTTYRYVTSSFAAERESGAAGTTVTRQTGFDNARYSCRIQRDAANALLETIRIGQILTVDEAIHYGNKPVTFSFTARAGADYSALNMQLVSKIYAGTATDNEGGNLTDFSSGSSVDFKVHNLLETEFRFRHTVTLPAGTRQIKVVLEFTPTGAALTNDYFEIANIKLENSSCATTYISDSMSVAQDKLDEYYLSTYENGVAAGTITDVGRHNYHAQAAVTAVQFALENVRFNFQRTPVATIYSPLSGDENKVVVDDGVLPADFDGIFTDVSTKNAIAAYNDAATVANEAKVYYHYVIDSRI